jgi:diaminopimelate decarboxylase
MNISYKLLKELDDKYGESFYLLFTDVFKENFDEFLGEFREFYPKTYIGYSYKTNYTPRLCEIIYEKGGYAEVVSEMEYDLALRVGVPPEQIIVNGPYKNYNALNKFLLGGSIVNLDSYRELDNLLLIADQNKEKLLNIGVRCNFEINNDLISRFGFDVEHDDFKSIFDRINKVKNISLKGLHCHFPNRDLESYTTRVEKMLLLIDEVFEKSPEFIDVGGGYFGKMNKELAQQFSCPVPKYNEYAEVIAKKINNHFSNLSECEKPKLFLEPGSAVVANTMNFVSKVIDIKQIREKRIAMTSGSKFNIGLLTSTINMPMTVLSKKNYDQKKTNTVTDISGYTCIEADYLYKGFTGSVEIDDYLNFENVGSYSVVFKPPFILPNVPVIEITKEGYSQVKRQETMEDIFTTFKFKNER